MNQYAAVSKNTAGSRPLKAAIHLAVAAAVLVSLPAFATLGGNSASVTADQTVLQASLKTSTQPAYTDYALTLANGIVVHEFVNSTNHVFEVTWYGKGMRPNMKQILGNSFSSYAAPEKERRPTSRHIDRIGANVEIHSEGHNRLFSGTAHIPSMIPASMPGALGVPERVSPNAVAAPNNGLR